MKIVKNIRTDKSSAASVGNDRLSALIVIFAILMFVGTAGTIVSEAIAALSGKGSGSDRMLVSAFLLNIALILFGWRRYRDLAAEIEVRTEAEERAHQLAITDPLTGCLNCRTLNDKASTMIAVAQGKNKSVAFLMLDLDKFKYINDLHGHSAGDAVLKEVVDRIARSLPPHNIFARLGGDEFACIFIFDPDRPEMVDRVAEDLIDNIGAPVVNDGNHMEVTTSIGIAIFDAGRPGVNTLIRRADIAMYSAKKQGRNRYCWFDIAMEKELHSRSMIETGMRQGLPAGEFVPCYEQQVDLTTGNLTGFEVQSRWNSPTQGSVSPEIFIPIAEDNGIIGDITLNVMRQAFEDAKSWNPALTLSFNISRVQFQDRWLAQKIVKLLVETGFPPNRLEIEIAEGTLLEDIILAQSILGSLTNQGIRIALGGFGVGYSSLAHLHALPFGRIKLNRSHVTSILENPGSAEIVNAIAKMGKSLGIPITAAGIENGAIEDKLRKIGCVTGQGWHYGQPLSNHQINEVLAEQSLLVTKPENSAQEAGPDDLKTERKAG